MVVCCTPEPAVDHSIYLERMKQNILKSSTCPKTPCGPVTARDASFQTHLDRVAAIKKGIDTPAVPNPQTTTGCCTTTVPRVFHYNDCWYIQKQAAVWSKFYN